MSSESKPSAAEKTLFWCAVAGAIFFPMQLLALCAVFITFRYFSK